MLQDATAINKSAPWPLNGVSCTAPAMRNSFLQIIFKRPALPSIAIVFGTTAKRTRFACMKVQNPLRLPRNMTMKHPKVVRTCCVFTILSLKLCFASQPRALFEQLNVQECSEPEVFSTSCLRNALCATAARTLLQQINVQKWSENEVFFTLLRVQLRALSGQLNVQKFSEPCVFLTFWLGNALRATAACIFSTGSKVLSTCCAFNILTWQCASSHGHVHFLIFLPTRWLSARRFSKPTFRPSGTTKQWKNTAFRDSTFQPLRARWPSCYWLSLLWLFPPPVAASAHIWEAWFLNFLRPSFDPPQWTLTNTATRKSWWKRGSSDSLAAANAM